MKIHQIEAREREYKEAHAVVDANRPKHGEWLRDGSTVYALMHYCWRNGVEQFRNAFSFHVYADIGSGLDSEELAARIIACVNACDRISTAALEVGAIEDRIASACGELYEVKRHRDDLLAALQKYVDHFGDPLKCARAAIAKAKP